MKLKNYAKNFFLFLISGLIVLGNFETASYAQESNAISSVAKAIANSSSGQPISAGTAGTATTTTTATEPKPPSSFDFMGILYKILVEVTKCSNYIALITNPASEQAVASLATLQPNFQSLGTFKGADLKATTNLIDTFFVTGYGGQIPEHADQLSFLSSLQNLTSNDSYVANVAGLNLEIPSAPSNLKGKSRADYIAMRNTVQSIQTYNGFIFKNFYANLADLTPSAALMQSTSDPNWIATIPTETIGTVLRQILLYVSQSYVVLDKMAINQQYAIATQAMTNTLLIAMGQGSAKLTKMLPSEPGPNYTPTPEEVKAATEQAQQAQEAAGTGQ